MSDEPPRAPSEEWRPVPGYAHLFEASTDGRIRSVRTGRELATRIGATGYPMLATWVGGRKGTAICVKVHRLVALAYVPGRSAERNIVNHINNVRTDNRVANLEWVTAGENMLHAYRIGARVPTRGEEHTSAKLTESQVLALRKRYENSPTLVGIGHLADRYGVDHSTLYEAIRGRTWRHLPMPKAEVSRIDRLLKRTEVQEYLGISKNQFWKYVREKPHFRTVKIGRHRLMREDALQEFVSKEEQADNPAAPTP